MPRWPVETVLSQGGVTKRVAGNRSFERRERSPHSSCRALELERPIREPVFGLNTPAEAGLRERSEHADVVMRE